MLKKLFDQVVVSTLQTGQFGLSDARLDILYNNRKSVLERRKADLLKRITDDLRSAGNARRFAEDEVAEVPSFEVMTTEGHPIYGPIWTDLNEQLDETNPPATDPPRSTDPKYQSSHDLIEAVKMRLQPGSIEDHRAAFQRIVDEEAANFTLEVEAPAKATKGSEEDKDKLAAQVAALEQSLVETEVFDERDRTIFASAAQAQVTLRASAIDEVYAKRLNALYRMFLARIQSPVVDAFNEQKDAFSLINYLFRTGSFVEYKYFPRLFVNGGKNQQNRMLNGLAMMVNEDDELGFQVLLSEDESNFRHRTSWTKRQRNQTDDTWKRPQVLDLPNSGEPSEHVFADWLDVPEHRELADGFEAAAGDRYEVRRQILALQVKALRLPQSRATERPGNQASSQQQDLVDFAPFKTALRLIGRHEWKVGFCLSAEGFIAMRFDNVEGQHQDVMRTVSLLLTATISKAMGCGKARSFPYAERGSGEPDELRVDAVVIPVDAIWPIEIKRGWKRSDGQAQLPLLSIASQIADPTVNVPVEEPDHGAVGYDPFFAGSVREALAQRAVVRVESLREGTISASETAGPQSKETIYRRLAWHVARSSVALLLVWIAATLSTVRPIHTGGETLLWKLSSFELWLVTLTFVTLSLWRVWVGYSLANPAVDKKISLRAESVNLAFRHPFLVWFGPIFLAVLVMAMAISDSVSASLAELVPATIWDTFKGDLDNVGTFRYAIYAAIWTLPVLSFGALVQSWTFVNDVAARENGVKQRISLISAAEGIWNVGRGFALRFLPTEDPTHFDHQTSAFSAIGSVKQRLQRSLGSLEAEDEVQSKRFATFSAGNATVVLLLGLLEPFGSLEPDDAELSRLVQLDILEDDLASFRGDKNACSLFKEVRDNRSKRIAFREVDEETRVALESELLVDCMEETNNKLAEKADSLVTAVRQQGTDIVAAVGTMKSHLAELERATKGEVQTGVAAIQGDLAKLVSTPVHCGPPFAGPCGLSAAGPQYRLLASLRTELAVASQKLQEAAIHLDSLGTERMVQVRTDTRDFYEDMERIRADLDGLKVKGAGVPAKLDLTEFKEQIAALSAKLKTRTDWMEGLPRDIEVNLDLNTDRFVEAQDELHQTVSAFKGWVDQNYHDLYPFIPVGLDPLFKVHKHFWDIDVNPQVAPDALMAKIFGQCEPIGSHHFETGSDSVDAEQEWYAWSKGDGEEATSNLVLRKASEEDIKNRVTGLVSAGKRFYVWGTTDGTGSASYNSKLAKDRARALQKRIVNWTGKDENEVVPLSGGEFGWVSGVTLPSQESDDRHRAAVIYSC